MQIKYTTQETVVRPVENSINIYGRYGMFTSAGNKSIGKKMENFWNKLQKITKELEETDEPWRVPVKQKVRKATEAVYRAWRRMHSSKTMGESSDTAVRESVVFTVKQLLEASNLLDSWDLDRLEESAYDNSY